MGILTSSHDDGLVMKLLVVMFVVVVVKMFST